MNRINNKENRRINNKEKRIRKYVQDFCVVQFIDLPFENINNYVCVPGTWMIIRTKAQKAAIAYPSDEDPSVTLDRVKTKEIYKDDWKIFKASIKYETDTYRDAEQWIATKNACEPLVKKASNINDTLPRIPINENISTECTQTEKAAVASNCNEAQFRSESTAQRAQTERTEQGKLAISLSVIDINEPTIVIDRWIDEGNHSQGIKKPDINNRVIQSHPVPAERITQPNQYSNQEHILDTKSSSSNFRQQEKLSSLELFAQIYSHINEARRLLSNPKPFEKKLCSTNNKINLALDQRCETQMTRIRNKTDRIICNNERAFYVVQFIESPFEDIDDFICVPYTWIIGHRAKDQKAVVVYPDNEHPTVTRYRAKRKERYNAQWRFYMTSVKYESDTYIDAEKWIATRITNDTEPRIPINENKLTKSTQTEETFAAFNCNKSTDTGLKLSASSKTNNLFVFHGANQPNIASAKVSAFNGRKYC